MIMPIGRLLPVILCALLLQGCITTEGRVFTNKPSPEEALQTRVELARRYIGEQNWADAKRNLKLAQQLDPDSPDVHEAFALVYQSTGEYELAEESFQSALKLQKDFSRARNNYAAFLYQQQRYAEAEEQLNIVVLDTLYPGRPRAFVNLGLCRLRLGDDEGAAAALERSLSMERTNPIALLELAEIRYSQERWRQSQRRYDAYRTVIKTQSPRSLWLGLRLANKLGESDIEASYALALRNMFPDSAEYQAYERARHRGEL
jgi:type IV pilus assembly protein PilF